MPLRERFEAVCDRCGDVSDAVDGPRSVAMLRLLRADWIVRKDGTAACPACAGPPSIVLTKRRSAR